jgi:hypothetical protein
VKRLKAKYAKNGVGLILIDVPSDNGKQVRGEPMGSAVLGCKCREGQARCSKIVNGYYSYHCSFL